jgi:FkbM family methyltransferase
MSIKKELSIIRRKTYEFFGSPKYSRPGLNGLDEKLEKYLNFKNGFFIEVGGNDGYSQSNTYYLEKFLGWRGILVEGIPHLYKQCQSTRNKSSVYNYALVSSDFKEDFVEMHYANLMSVVEGSLKSNENQVKQIEKGLEIQKIKDTYSLKVPTKTLESILCEYTELPQIDFFSLDVEGYELDVLQGLNITKYQPRYILVEARFFDDVNTFLTPYYDMIEQLTYHDYLYRLRKDNI